MSFGFSITDFITLADIATTLVSNYRNAPSDYDLILSGVADLGDAISDTGADLRRLRRIDRDLARRLEKSRDKCKNLLEDAEKFLEKHEAIRREGKVEARERIKFMMSDQKKVVDRIKQQASDLHDTVQRVHLSIGVKVLEEARLPHTFTIVVNPVPSGDYGTESSHHHYSQNGVLPPEQQEYPGSDPSAERGRWSATNPEKPSSRTSYNRDDSPNEWDPRRRIDTDKTLTDLSFPPFMQTPNYDSGLTSSPHPHPRPTRDRTASSATSSTYSSICSNKPRNASNASSVGSSTYSSISSSKPRKAPNGPAPKRKTFLGNLVNNFGQSPALAEGGSSAAYYCPPPPPKERKEEMEEANPARETPPLIKKKNWRDSLNVKRNLGGSSVAWQ